MSRIFWIFLVLSNVELLHTQLQIRITHSCRSGRALAVQSALYSSNSSITWVNFRFLWLLCSVDFADRKPERESLRERICPPSTADYLNFKTEQNWTNCLKEFPMFFHAQTFEPKCQFEALNKNFDFSDSCNQENEFNCWNRIFGFKIQTPKKFLVEERFQLSRERAVLWNFPNIKSRISGIQFLIIWR